MKARDFDKLSIRACTFFPARNRASVRLNTARSGFGVSERCTGSENPTPCRMQRGLAAPRGTFAARCYGESVTRSIATCSIRLGSM